MSKSLEINKGEVNLYPESGRFKKGTPRLRRRTFIKAASAFSATILFPALTGYAQEGADSNEVGEPNPEAAAGPHHKIAFALEYEGKDPNREQEADRMLTALWQSAISKGSPTLTQRTAFFIKNTDTYLQKIDDVKIGGKLIGLTRLAVVAPDLETFKKIGAHPEIPVDLRTGSKLVPLLEENGQTRDVIEVDMMLYIGDTNYQNDPNSIEAYAQYILYPNALIAFSNLELREIIRQGIIRQGMTDPEELKSIVGNGDSDFYKRLRTRAWDRMFTDTRNIFREVPDGWEQRNTYFRKYYGEWLEMFEDQQKTQEDRIIFIRENILKN